MTTHTHVAGSDGCGEFVNGMAKHGSWRLMDDTVVSLGTSTFHEPNSKHCTVCTLSRSYHVKFNMSPISTTSIGMQPVNH